MEKETAMSRQDILMGIRQALEGSRKIRVRFRSQALGLAAVSILKSMKGADLIGFDNENILDVETWSTENGRTCIITLMPRFNAEWFTSDLSRYIEEIAVA